MKEIIISLCMGLLFCTPTLAKSTCFLAQEKGITLKHEGSDCNKRYAPESTFKIALSLMGFDAGILRIEKDGRVITFADHLADSKQNKVFASFRARNDALIKLWYLIDELEK